MIYVPHNYQKHASDHIISNPGHTDTDHMAGLFMEVGTGKTSVTLSAITYLLNCFEVDKVLIVAPKRVASQSWKAEIEKWDHTKNLKLSRIIGKPKERITALNQKAEIYTVSRDNIAWLIDYYANTKRKWDFDMVVVDESSDIKTPSSMRFKALKRIIPVTPYRVILTGTPTPHSLLDLWSQIYFLDKGERLGKTYGVYKETYFKPGARNGHTIFKWELKDGAAEQIYAKIADICLSMKAKDYLELPDRIDVFERAELDNFDKYQQFKKQEVLELLDGEELTPVNAASLYSLLLQFSNGAVYRPDGSYEVVDNTKLDILQEKVEAKNGEPIFVFYQFRSDCERIRERMPQFVKIETDEQIEAWCRGEIPAGIAHAKSIGYGINLQSGGWHLLHFGVGWARGDYDQSVGRFHRQGQGHPVTNEHLTGKDTVEEIVLASLGDKGWTQDQLMEALKAHIYK